MVQEAWAAYLLVRSDVSNDASTKEITPISRTKGWVLLLLTFLLLYLFGVYVGPWLQHHIYGMDEIAAVMEAQDIDGGAYFYTEIEGAADGHAYLNQSMQQMAPDHYGFTFPFIFGIICSLLILYFGFRHLPR